MTMTDLRPVDLPEARHELINAFNTEAGHRWFTSMAEDGHLYGLHKPGDIAPDAIGYGYLEATIRALAHAELYYVTRPMTTLALQAARSLPEFQLNRVDLPCDYGLIYFDQPVRVVDGLAYRMATWAPSATVGAPGWGTVVIWWAELPADTSLDEARAAAGMPGLLPEGADHYAFTGEGPIEELILVGDPAHRAISLDTSVYPLKHQTLRTAWLLMQQPVTSVTEEPLDRHTRKRLARNDITDLRAPRVITLRQRRTTQDGTSQGREYHHQWIVNGHWRQQWYASQQRHKPIWIAPHIKGPEGAPILGGEKVYAWRR